MRAVEKAVVLLSDMSSLIDAPEAGKLRTLMRQVVEAVWIEKNDAGEIAVAAIKPAPIYTLLLPAVADVPSMMTLTGNGVTLSTSARRIPELWDAFGVEMRHGNA